MPSVFGCLRHAQLWVRTPTPVERSEMSPMNASQNDELSSWLT